MHRALWIGKEGSGERPLVPSYIEKDPLLKNQFSLYNSLKALFWTLAPENEVSRNQLLESLRLLRFRLALAQQEEMTQKDEQRLRESPGFGFLLAAVVSYHNALARDDQKSQERWAEFSSIVDVAKALRCRKLDAKGFHPLVRTQFSRYFTIFSDDGKKELI